MRSNSLIQMFVLAAIVALVAGCGSSAPKAETTPESQPGPEAQAAPEAAAPKYKKPAFEELDTNGDGFIELDELNGAFFAKVDTDGDGKISKEEHAAARAKFKKHGHHKKPCAKCAGHKGGHGHHKKSFEEIDANADGFVTKDECGCPEGMFAKVDADGDGKVTKEEHEAGRGKHACPECAKRPKGECPHCAKQKEGHGHHKRMTFEECDVNSDGFITMDEFKKGERFLAKKDTDQDGKLSKEEYEAPCKKACKCKGKGHGHHGKPAAEGETQPVTE